MNQGQTDYAALAAATYLPATAKIVEIREMTARERYYRLELPQPLGHRPGQFAMVSVLGVGEAPISISCGPRDDNQLEMVIRNVGRLTRVIHGLKEGDTLGIRGPYGSGFDLDHFYGKDVVFIAGGLGLVPLRSLIIPVMAEPSRFGAVTLVSGCRNPAEELFREDLKQWSQVPGATVIRLVDATENMPWKFDVGLVIDPLPKLPLDPVKTVVAMCGPPVMYKFVLMTLQAKNLGPEQIFVDLERRMKCGVGKCGHCQMNHLYCCQDGPVFQLSRIGALKEALR